MGGDSIKWLCILMILHLVNWVCGVCELSLVHNDNVYNYSLTSPLDKYPHGVLSEDGFYKVAVNQTVLWFQLCDGMIFNHDPPVCVDCLDCGGPSHCGLGCSALVEKSIGGYDHSYASNRSCDICRLPYKNHPNNGVIVKMTHSGPKYSCSLSVSVICDLNGLQATEIRHPSGCATIIPAEGGGWGWFGTFVTVILCLFGIYLLAGTAYRYFFLGIHGLHTVMVHLSLLEAVPCNVKQVSTLLCSSVRKTLMLCLLSGVEVWSVDSSHSSVYLPFLRGEWDSHSVSPT
ncbi:Autophagy-like protein [Citrus sinensis]|uniref:Autophagy-like protein n=2 Tax=Citrus sinensis TaxID=2711 RepID=A0ACB8L1Y2_CITSI|nr:Autophagy-like protein [Citrus sinensis]